MQAIRRPTAEPSAGESGFTLLEMVVVMSILGVVMAMGVFGFTNWRDTAQQQGTADELVSSLRNASTRAISEGRTYCVEIAADRRSYRQWRVTCGTGTQVSSSTPAQGSAVTLDATVPFPASSPLPASAVCPATSKCLYFYPRGTAIPAQVVVRSSARTTTTYTVRVEGLTARVYQ